MKEREGLKRREAWSVAIARVYYYSAKLKNSLLSLGVYCREKRGCVSHKYE